MKTPWMKFYPADWRSDAALKICSLAARGLWIEMIGIMHESDRYGHLTVGSRILDDATLSVLIGAPTHEITALLGELRQAGVFTQSSDGAIYSRRMVRDYKRSAIGRKNVKKRWSKPVENTGQIGFTNSEPISRKKPEARKKEKENTNVFSKKKNGCRLPDGWQPSDDLLEWTRQQGLSPPEIANQTAQFVDYWRARAGAGGVKLDWDATWRNWIRKNQEQRGKSNGYAGHMGKPTKSERADRAAAEAVAECLAELGFDNQPSGSSELRSVEDLWQGTGNNQERNQGVHPCSG